jgi:hypothetical protein
MENENKPAVKRLQSLDALRGFDMFWIMGGEGIFAGLASLTGWPLFKWWATQCQHVPWYSRCSFSLQEYRFLFHWQNAQQIMIAVNQYINMLSAVV